MLGKWAVFSESFNIESVVNKFSFLSQFLVGSFFIFSESPFGGNDDALSSREFVLGSLHDHNSLFNLGFFASDGHQNAADFHTGHATCGFSEGSSHTSLQSICSGAGQHLVDTDNVPRVDAHSHVESIFS